MKKLLAKGFRDVKGDCITLRDHTEDVMKCVEHLISSSSAKFVMENGNKIGIRLNGRGMLRVLKLAAFLHDLGKVSPAFQRSLGNKAIRDSYLDFWESFPGVRHNVFSLFFINKRKVLEVCEGNEVVARVLLSAVALHHWKGDEKEYFLHINSDLVKACEMMLSKKNGKVLGDYFADMLRDHFEGFEDELFGSENLEDFIEFDRCLADHIVSGGGLDSVIIPPYCVSFFLPERMKYEVENNVHPVLWVFLLGSLIRADHFASFVEGDGRGYRSIHVKLEDVEIEPRKTNVVDILTRKYGTNGAWQRRVLDKCSDKNVILIAPTGIGKTEFALAWGDGSKTFFTLPFRAATNQIFERACNYHCSQDKKDKVGLLHSDADLYLFEKSKSSNVDVYEGEILTVLEIARQLSFPLNVCTGDQIFPTALKYPIYERVMSALINAKLVIDEVQAYDPRACAVVLRMIADTVIMGGKFLLMTATLPGFVLKTLKEEIGEDEFTVINLYKELPNLSQLVRHKAVLKELDIEDSVEEIIKTANQGKRVLVVLNTVDKANRVYSKICEQLEKKGISGWVKHELIHARFPSNERKNREKRAEKMFNNPKPEGEKEPKILVATQVVEASLDLDADYLYTEICPMDSLIQRMGRVMRRINLITGKVKGSNKDFVYEDYYSTEEPNIYVFYQKGRQKKLESGKGGVYDTKLLEKTLEVLEEGERGGIFEIIESKKQDLVEHVYLELANSFYLRKFYETLEVLRGGYAAGSKHEAEKIFREIRTVNIVESENIPVIVEKIKTELERKGGINWLWFKKEIIGNYVVSENERKLKKNQRLSLTDELIVHFEDTDVWRKLKRYSEGIWVRNEKADNVDDFDNII